jgi:hypothetical protein
VIARIRKAVIAGLGAGIAAGIGAIATAGALTKEEGSKALGVGIVAAATVGYATFRVPNKPTYATGGVIKPLP